MENCLFKSGTQKKIKIGILFDFFLCVKLFDPTLISTRQPKR
jgi:hypothetical protein